MGQGSVRLPGRDVVDSIVDVLPDIGLGLVVAGTLGPPILLIAFAVTNSSGALSYGAQTLDWLVPAMLAIFLGSYLISWHVVPVLRDAGGGAETPGPVPARRRRHDLAPVGVPLAIAGAGLVALFWLDGAACALADCNWGDLPLVPDVLYSGMTMLTVALALLVVEALRRRRRGSRRWGLRGNVR